MTPPSLFLSGALAELFVDPQPFMDAVAVILKHELHRLPVDGIKYKHLPNAGPEAEWVTLFSTRNSLTPDLAPGAEVSL